MSNLVGLPEDILGEDTGVIDTFDIGGIKLKKRDFHAIHRLRNNKLVVLKLVNRQNAIAILGTKKTTR